MSALHLLQVFSNRQFGASDFCMRDVGFQDVYNNSLNFDVIIITLNLLLACILYRH